MSDLASILSTMGKTPVGGYMAGMGFANYQKAQEADREKAALDLAIKRAAEQRESEKHPLSLADLQAQTEGRRATTQSTLADVTQKGLDNDFTRATQPGKIQATNATNQGLVLKQQADVAARVGPALKQAAAAVDWSQVQGPGQAVAALQQFLESQGAAPQNAQMLYQSLSRIPASGWAKALSALGDTFIRSSASFQESMYKEEQSNKRNAATIAAQDRRLDKEIEAGKYNRGAQARTTEQALLRATSAKQTAEILEAAYYTAMANKDLAAAAEYKQRAEAARQRAAEDERNRGVAIPRPDVSNYGIPTLPGPSATAPIAGGQPQVPRGTPQNPIKLD